MQNVSLPSDKLREESKNIRRCPHRFFNTTPTEEEEEEEWTSIEYPKGLDLRDRVVDTSIRGAFYRPKTTSKRVLAADSSQHEA